MRLPPFPLSRLEMAFSANSNSELSREEQERASGVFLKDVHMSMIRILEGSDVSLLEPPTLAGYGSAAELYPKNVFRCAFGSLPARKVAYDVDCHLQILATQLIEAALAESVLKLDASSL